jgi:membrane-associated HD superfamily phosphohydrolase
MTDSIDLNPERKRKKREGLLILIILITVAILTFIETRITHFGNDFPLSSTVLMFILINTNLLLLLALLLLVFRNLAKLYCSGAAADNGSLFFLDPVHLHEYCILVQCTGRADTGQFHGCGQKTVRIHRSRK